MLSYVEKMYFDFELCCVCVRFRLKQTFKVEIHGAVRTYEHSMTNIKLHCEFLFHILYVNTKEYNPL